MDNKMQDQEFGTTFPKSRNQQTTLHILILVALVRFILHLLTNNQYGFHQDALAFLANGQSLAWGYLTYPPLTPFIGRIGLELFGLSLVGIKSLAALSQCIAMVFTGLMAKEMGGGLRAQIVASISAGIAVMSLLMSTLFQYITFDYLWWVLVLYCLLKLLNTKNPRWWVGVGIFIGLGMMTKYTMVFLVIGIVFTFLITDLRQQLTSRWLWLGVFLSILIFLPNLIWQIQHDFISLDFLTSIRERDELLGRADGFFSQQLYVNVNPFVLPLVIAGILALFSKQKATYRPLGIVFVVTLILLALVRSRFYYAAPLYPILIAAGAVVGEKWLQQQTPSRQKLINRGIAGILTIGGLVGILLALPVAPVNSALWQVTSDIHDNFLDQIGWEELAETTATIYQQNVKEHPSLAILTSHYGSYSAILLYGKQYNLPEPISPVNDFWWRGYGDTPPKAVITIGFDAESLDRYFGQCRLVGTAENKYQIEKPFPKEIFLCEQAKDNWDNIWLALQRYS